MIRKPQWLSDKLREIAHDILNDRATIIDAAEKLAGEIDAHDGAFSLEVITEKCQSWIKQEMHRLVRGATKIAEDEERTGQGALMPLPFPWLPAYLEIAPGRTVHQRAMTGPDMDHARAIWQNRRDQAEISWRAFERAYELVRPLLSDDKLMVADVADQLGIDWEDGEASSGGPGPDW